MSKVLVRNKIANKTFGFNLPCDVSEATSFCIANLEGTFEVYESLEPIDNGVAVGANVVTVTGKNSAGYKHTFTFYAKGNLNEDEIKTALLNKTFNNVKFDEVYIIRFESYLNAAAI